jgi:RimJ/RimL family protein N-acetyltransferase
VGNVIELPIETERLLIRPLRLEDADELGCIIANERRRLGYATDRSRGLWLIAADRGPATAPVTT